MKGPVGILVVLLILWMAGCTYCYVCEIKGLCGNEAVAQVAAPATKTPVKPAANMGFNVKDGSFLAQSPNGAMFAKSGSKLESNGQLDNALTKIGGYLKSNPNKTFQITGGYMADEKNRTWSENLGEARAKEVRSAILKKTGGLDKDQIIVKGLQNSNLKFANNRTNAGMQYAFVNVDRSQNKATREKNMAAIASRLKGQGKNFYFDAGSNQIDLDAEMRTYFRELRQYMDYDKNAKVTLTGHTDADGDADGNRALGQKRAERILQYMAQNGMAAGQLSATSKGEDSPIADNNTPEGKAKNRRVEIRLN